jgi:inosine/xanthosine triphosphatase
MRIAIGSTNPAKVAAVRQVAGRQWPDAHLLPVEVPSGVSAMPMDDQECLAGARQRAAAALQALDADLGIGLEGGVHPTAEGLMLTGWAAVVDRQGRQGIGAGGRLPLPAAIARRVAAGEELGPVMDLVLGQENVRQKGGAVGALTAGLVLREQAFAMAVAYALAPFLAAHLYEEE